MSGETGDVGPTTAEPGDPEYVLRDVREAFIRAFDGRLGSISALLTGGPLDAVSRERARELLHRMAGLAGMIGFPQVSGRAAELEDAVRQLPAQGMDPAAVQAGLDAIREAFERERTVGALREPQAPSAAARPTRILLVEDDDDQRTVFESWLRAAGYQPVVLTSGEAVLPSVRERRPALVLMDVELPGPDGVSVCRLLKSDPALATLPVVLMSTRTAPEDRLAGLTAGADEYLNKPVDLQELVLRIHRLLSPRETTARMGAESALDNETFTAVARDELRRAPTALALVKVPAEHRQTAASPLLAEVRRRDLLGVHDSSHLALLLVDIPAASACRRVRDILEAAAQHGVNGLHAGVAVAGVGQRTLEELLAEADEALTEARYRGEPAAMRSAKAPAAAAAAPTVMVAEDDPEVTRIVDAQMKAAGYRTVVCFDGRQALEALQAHMPDVLVLDLLMPKLTGFDVLAKLREMPARPRVIVLSGHGREEDVTRAFDLGADDYLTKPFSPRELIARVARLLKG